MNQDQQLREAAQRCVSFRIGNMGNYSEQAVKLMNIRLAFQSLAAPERVLELLDEIDSLRAALTATQQAAPSQGDGERICVQFESKFSNMLQAAWMDGWGACRDSEFIGSEAMQDAFNRCDTLALCIAIDQSDDAALLEASARRDPEILRPEEISAMKDELAKIAVAVGRSKTDGHDCDWFDLAGDVEALASAQREQPAAESEAEYFSKRPQIDCNDRRVVFRAGFAAGRAADDSNPNAPWLTEAHMLCTDQGIPLGHITARIRALRDKLDADDKAGGEVQPELDVRKIMIGIVPGPDGEGVEVYAKSVADVERLLSDMGQRLEDYEGNTRPQPQAEETIEQMAERLASKGWQAVVCGACGSEMAVGYPKPQAAQPAEPSGIDAGENPPNKTLYLMMARHGLNMVVGEDMGRLLAFGRDVWRGAQSERPADRVALTDEQIATFAEATAQAILFDLQGRRGIMDGVDEQVQQEIVSEHTAIIRSQLSGHGITAKDQP